MRFLFLIFCFPTFVFGQINLGQLDTIPQAQSCRLVYKIVEEMPQFGECGEIRVLRRSKCFQDYLCENLKYPEFAKKHGVRGNVIVSFIINELGNAVNAKIIQDIGAGCGTATLDFVNNLPRWEAGKQRGKKVKVQYKLKVNYQLPDLGCLVIEKP